MRYLFLFTGLLLALLCQGCGLGYMTLQDAMESEPNQIPSYREDEADSKERIMAAAAEHPQDAMISGSFYRVATQAEVREIAALSPGAARSQNKLGYDDRDWLPNASLHDPSFAVMFGLCMFFPCTETTVETRYPLDYALACSPYPDTLKILFAHEAKCGEWLERYRGIPDAERLDILLAHCPPSKDDFNDLLHRVATGREDDPALLTVLLKHAPKLNVNHAEGDVTPFRAALLKKNVRIARALLDAGAVPHEKGLENLEQLEQELHKKELQEEQPGLSLR